MFEVQLVWKTTNEGYKHVQHACYVSRVDQGCSAPSSESTTVALCVPLHLGLLLRCLFKASGRVNACWQPRHVNSGLRCRRDCWCLMRSPADEHTWVQPSSRQGKDSFIWDEPCLDGLGWICCAPVGEASRETAWQTGGVVDRAREIGSGGMLPLGRTDTSRGVSAVVASKSGFSIPELLSRAVTGTTSSAIFAFLAGRLGAMSFLGFLFAPCLQGTSLSVGLTSVHDSDGVDSTRNESFSLLAHPYLSVMIKEGRFLGIIHLERAEGLAAEGLLQS